jgi:glutaredoxin
MSSKRDCVNDAALKRDLMAKMKEAEWFIVGSNSCPYCRNVIGLLQNYGVEKISYMELDSSDSSNEYVYRKFILPMIRKTDPNWNTIPIVFYRKKFIGGYEDTKKYLQALEQKKNKLEKFDSKIQKLSDDTLPFYKYIESEDGDF